jgi:hypothetical protein
MLTIALLITITLQGVYPYPVSSARYVSRIHNQNPVCLDSCVSYLQLCQSIRWSDCQSVYPDDPQAGLCFAQGLSNCIAEYDECRQACQFLECDPTDPPPCPGE